MLSRLSRVVDLAATAIALPCAGAYVLGKAAIAKAVHTAPERTAKRVLLVIQTMHSYASIVESGHDEIITQAGLDGFFDRVYTLYPTIGSDTAQPIEDFTGASREIPINPVHTFIEYKMSFLGLPKLPTLDFVLSQAIVVDQMIDFCRAHDVSVIRGNCPFFTGLYAMLIAKVLDIPYSLRIGGNYDLMHQNGLMVYRKIYRSYSIAKRVGHVVLKHADTICAVNDNNRNYCIENGARQDRAIVVRYGNMVDPIHFGPVVGRKKILKELGIGQRPIAVCVGRLNKVKHPEDVLAATLEAIQKVPDLLTLFVGSGDMLEELETMVTQMGIADNVMFLGKRNQDFLASLYAEADVYLSPLTGRSMVEAALASIPLIAYDYEWHAEFVHQDQTGLLVPYRDTSAMGQALAALLQDKQRAKRLGQNARELALDLMDKTKILELERESYRQVLEYQ